MWQGICTYRVSFGGVGKDPFKGVAFLLGLLYTFVLASIAELQDGSFGCLASTCVWKNSWAEGIAFYLSLFEDIQALAGLALRSRRQIHHRLLPDLLMYVKAPAPCQFGRSNIAFSHILYPQ
jgi:hypothetical protein